MSVAGRGNRGLRYGVRGSEGELKELWLLWVTAQQGVSEGRGKDEFTLGQIVQALFSHGKEFIEDWSGR